MLKVFLDENQPPDRALVLQVQAEDLELRADTTFFALGEDPQTVSANNLRRRIASLLIQWLRKLERLAVGEACYLPFDVDAANRHIGCFQVRAVEANRLLVLYGYTVAFAGKPLPPEQALHFSISEVDFVVDTTCEIFFAPRREFLLGLNQSVANLMSQPWG